MNGSLDTASTAGTESRAKIRSVNSTTTSAAKSGVATRLAFCTVKNLWPSNSSVNGIKRRKIDSPLDETSSSSSSDEQEFEAVQERGAEEDESQP